MPQQVENASSAQQQQTQPAQHHELVGSSATSSGGSSVGMGTQQVQRSGNSRLQVDIRNWCVLEKGGDEDGCGGAGCLSMCLMGRGLGV